MFKLEITPLIAIQTLPVGKYVQYVTLLFVPVFLSWFYYPFSFSLLVLLTVSVNVAVPAFSWTFQECLTHFVFLLFLM